MAQMWPTPFYLVLILVTLFFITILAVLSNYYYARRNAFGRYGVRYSWSLIRYLNKLCKRENHIWHDYKMRREYQGERFHGRFECDEPIIVAQDVALMYHITETYFESFLDRTDIEFERDVEPFKASSLYNMKANEWKVMRPKLCHGFSAFRVRSMVPLLSKVAEKSIHKLLIQFIDNKFHEMDIRKLSLCMVNELIAACVFGKTNQVHRTKRNYFYVLGNFIAGNKLDPNFQNPYVTSEDLIYPEVPNKPIVMEDALRFFTEAMETAINTREARRTKQVDMVQFYTDLKNGWLYSHEKPYESSPSTLITSRKKEKMRSKNADASTSRKKEKKRSKNAGASTSRKRNTEENMSLQFAIKETNKYEQSRDQPEFGLAAVSNLDQPDIKDITWTYRHFALQAGSVYGHGYKQVAMAVTFALHELALNPECQGHLVKEIYSQNDRIRGMVTIETLQNMKYLDMVVAETLRKWPPIPYLNRVCTDQTFDIGEPRLRATERYVLRKGETIGVPIFANHRDGRFFKDPHKFNPERFNSFSGHQALAYHPFGIGPRNCLGAKLALVQIKVLLYFFLLHLEVEPSNRTSRSIMPSGMSSELELQGGHWLKVKSRITFPTMRPIRRQRPSWRMPPS